MKDMIPKNSTSIGYIGDARDLDKKALNTSLTFADLQSWVMRSQNADSVELFYDEKYEQQLQGTLQRLEVFANSNNISLYTHSIDSLDSFLDFMNQIEGSKAIEMIHETSRYPVDFQTYLNNQNKPVSDAYIVNHIVTSNEYQYFENIASVNNLAQDAISGASRGGMPDTDINIHATNSTTHAKRGDNTFVSATHADSTLHSAGKNIVNNASSINNAYGIVGDVMGAGENIHTIHTADQQYKITKDSLDANFDTCMKSTQDINNSRMFARDYICYDEFGGKQQHKAIEELVEGITQVAPHAHTIIYGNHEGKDDHALGQENFVRD